MRKIFLLVLISRQMALSLFGTNGTFTLRDEWHFLSSKRMALSLFQTNGTFSLRDKWHSLSFRDKWHFLSSLFFRIWHVYVGQLQVMASSLIGRDHFISSFISNVFQNLSIFSSCFADWTDILGILFFFSFFLHLELEYIFNAHIFTCLAVNLFVEKKKPFQKHTVEQIGLRTWKIGEALRNTKGKTTSFRCEMDGQSIYEYTFTAAYQNISKNRMIA